MQFHAYLRIYWLSKNLFGIKFDSPFIKIFFMLLLCVVQFHLRWRNWFSHSRKPNEIPLVIFFSKDVLFRLSCLQISRILFGNFCVFLQTCVGSKRMLLPSALMNDNKIIKLIAIKFKIQWKLAHLLILKIPTWPTLDFFIGTEISSSTRLIRYF